VSLRAPGRRSLASRLLFIKLKGLDPRRLLERLLPWYRPVHHPLVLASGLAIIAVGLALFVAHAGDFAYRPDRLLQLGSIALIMLTVFMTLVVHEFAHALACHYYGGEVREMGFLLLFFQPCFYADVSDAWLFPRKSHRLTVTWVGPFVQFLLFALAVIVWRVTVPGTFPSRIALIIILVSGISVLFNFNPLIKLDGYYLLSDWLDIPNLRARAFGYLGAWSRRVLLGWPVESVPVPRREKRIYLAYAVLAVLYSGLLIGVILVWASKFLLANFGGWGLLALVVVLTALLKDGLAAAGRGFVQHLKYMSTSLRNPVRVSAYLLAGASMAIGLFAVPFPHRVSGEVTVAPIAEFNLRLNEFGMLERTLIRRGEDPESRSGYMQMVSQDMASLDLTPLVSDGDRVEEGDTLAMLLSNQLSTELVAALAELDRLRRELVLLKSPPKPEAVAEAIAEVNAAQATLAQQERQFQRLRELRERDGISTEQYEAAESALELARAELANRQARLDLLKAGPKPEQEAVVMAQIDKQRARVEFLQTQKDAQSITSPVAGTVRIAPDDGRILSVLNSGTIEVLVPVSDFDIDLVETRRPVLLKVRSYPQRMFLGEVRHIPSAAQSLGGSARFLVSAVVSNEDNALAAGMTGYAKIEIGRISVAAKLGRKIASFLRVEFWSWW
ncbi:MAG TPA: hypothetical protein PK112_06315, partial [candidate division Zixibacteria bacterium]|nr:hypothetical protein [candidate division Zixibacteria bacterium]